MADLRILLKDKELKYTGLIDVKGLYRLLFSFFEDNDFYFYESRNEEQHFDDEKQILLKLEGNKKFAEFTRLVMEVEVYFTHLKEVFVEKEGKKVKMHQGTVLFKTDVVLMTDYFKTFEQNAFQFFLRTLMNKYVLKPYMDRHSKLCMKYYAGFEKRIKTFLNIEPSR